MQPDSSRLLNLTAAAPDGEDGDQWAAFEALPVALRRRLAEHNYNICAVFIRHKLEQETRRCGNARVAEIHLLCELDWNEQVEIKTFSAAYRDQFGTETPHVAAGASVMRYAAQRGRRS